MTFDTVKAERLQLRYNEAVANNEEQFVFEGHELLTAYAKYLLQFLQMEGLLSNEASTVLH